MTHSVIGGSPLSIWVQKSPCRQCACHDSRFTFSRFVHYFFSIQNRRPTNSTHFMGALLYLVSLLILHPVLSGQLRPRSGPAPAPAFVAALRAAAPAAVRSRARGPGPGICGLLQARVHSSGSSTRNRAGLRAGAILVENLLPVHGCARVSGACARTCDGVSCSCARVPWRVDG